jgi:Mce-associated membrane protein
MTAGRARRVAWWLLVVALTVATLAAASVGGWQLLIKTRQPPRVADQPAARQAAIQAASTGTVKVLSYSSETLDQDFDAASAVLTGDFREYYKKFTSQIVRPAAQEKRMTTKATVQRAGVESLTRDGAEILVFVNQTTTSKDQPSPSNAASSVRVGVAKVNGTWLINRFNPV